MGEHAIHNQLSSRIRGNSHRPSRTCSTTVPAWSMAFGGSMIRKPEIPGPQDQDDFYFLGGKHFVRSCPFAKWK